MCRVKTIQHAISTNYWEDPERPRPSGPPDSDVPTPRASCALSPHCLHSPRRPRQRGLGLSPPSPGPRPIPTSAPGRADPSSREQPGRCWRSTPVRILGGVAAAGGWGRRARAEKAIWPFFSKHKMAFEYRVPHPHPSTRSAEHLPSFHPPEWGRGQGVGRRSPLG